MREFKHRGCEIQIDSDGSFWTSYEDELLRASSLPALKKQLDSRVTKGRKFNVACELLVIEQCPHIHQLNEKVVMTTKPATYRGVNLHTREAKLRYEGDTNDYEGDSYDESWYALPVWHDGSQLGLDQARLVRELEEAVKGYNTAALELKKQLQGLTGSDMSNGPGDKDALIAWEKEQADRLGG